MRKCGGVPHAQMAGGREESRMRRWRGRENPTTAEEEVTELISQSTWGSPRNPPSVFRLRQPRLGAGRQESGTTKEGLRYLLVLFLIERFRCQLCSAIVKRAAQLPPPTLLSRYRGASKLLYVVCPGLPPP
ncbi:unnamed protein product [Lepidochelys kempii]